MSLFPDDVVALATEALAALRRAGLRAATAESCTGGLIAAALTEIAGSSDGIGRSFVTYSNLAKREVLGVRAETLAAHGAVSPQTVTEMAEGLLRIAGDDADLAVAVSGLAGPGGGSPEKPVGTVHLAIASRGGPTATLHRVYAGDRSAVRLAAVRDALALIKTRAAG
ncbi:MAG: nicotinamide-nucleotide amidohydrolase family protein [Alphaproteobacteria bacterium]|nr:nicotinamide-nucleotide amidohydrolase family protein [Alphaproteobacteria bacterium]MCB9928337.1 nicotinamide-nucleotide amidohydrolase family protein [Alphaproteobacteria bacterium]